MTNLGAAFHHCYAVEARDRDGNLLWAETVDNLIVNEGLNDILDKYWKGSGYTAAHYVGLTGQDPEPAAGDTMASHSGWTEVTAYSEGTRPQLQMGAVTGQSVSNSGNKATFTVNADGTEVGGAFVATNSTKGGSSGTLIGIAALSTNRTLGTGDTLSITVTSTAGNAA